MYRGRGNLAENFADEPIRARPESYCWNRYKIY